jgi:citrate synthase
MKSNGAVQAQPKPNHMNERKDAITITDHRTGREYEIPIEHDTINAMDLRQIKVKDDDFGMMAYDPGFKNTASCKSRITYIDGDKGILEYRGYPIDQLAEKSSFLEVAYLLNKGELPTTTQLAKWTNEITHHTIVHKNLKKFMDGFHHDAHPMVMLISTIAALRSFYPFSGQIEDPDRRHLQIVRLLAKTPTLAAMAYRHSCGLPYIFPDNDLSYSGNFLNMLLRKTESKYDSDPILERALDVLFILHGDHEQNCSASAMRNIGSSHVDPYSAMAGAAAALFGPLHGGANEMVLRMLDEIGGKKDIPEFIKKVKAGEALLMGFGHRVYKNYDPRAKIIREIAHKVFEVTGTNPKLELAMELEKIALEDEYFVKRKLYPNVDFYSGIIYQAMGFPVTMYPVLFAIGRAPGWLAQWNELLEDAEQKIARPRQIYLGHRNRDFVPIDKRY